MTTIKAALSLMALAAGVAACGTTATAKASPTTTAGPTTAPTVDCGHPNTPPKNMPPKPVADNCWAGGFWLGQGSFHNRKIIYADKAGITALYAITPQLLRTNPHVAATLEQAAAEFATTNALGEWMPSTVQQAKAGDSLATTTNVNPLGLVYNYPVIVTGGISDIPTTGQPTKTFPVGSKAEVGECVNMQAYVVSPNGHAINNIAGKTGLMQWTDQLTKTQTGWKISKVDMALHPRTTPC